MQTVHARKTPSGSGRELNKKWNVGARHALYRETGDWYNHLTSFPGALFDKRGYVLFKTEEEYRRSPYLQLGKEVGVPGGIASMPGYVEVEKPSNRTEI